jgi:hypothetical protein
LRFPPFFGMMGRRAYSFINDKIRGDGDMKKAGFLVILALAFLLTLAGPGQAAASGDAAPPPYEGPGWETPEDAVQAYLDAFGKADLRGMVSAFAIETYVEHFDFEAQLDRLGAYLPQAEIPYPNANDFFKAMNVEKRRSGIVNSIHYQFFTLRFPEIDLGMLTSFSGDGAPTPGEFADRMNAVTQGPAEGYALLAFADPASLSEHYLQPRNQENLAKLAGIYGAEELQSMAALIAVEGKPHLLCCDAIRYGDKWYLCSLGGNIGALLGMSVMQGGLSPAP